MFRRARRRRARRAPQESRGGIALPRLPEPDAGRFDGAAGRRPAPRSARAGACRERATPRSSNTWSRATATSSCTSRPSSRRRWLLWFGPFAFLLGGGVIWFMVLRRRRRRGGDDEPAPAGVRRYRGRRPRPRAARRIAGKVARATASRRSSSTGRSWRATARRTRRTAPPPCAIPADSMSRSTICARSRSHSRSIHTCGCATSGGTSPTMLDACWLNTCALMPAWFSRSATS